MRSLLLVFAFCNFLPGYSQDYKTQFEQSFQDQDTLKQWEVLQEWEKADAKNAELFVSFFNYYFMKSKREIIAFTDEAPDGESLQLVDSSGQSAGYMGSEIYFDVDIAQKGLNKIDEGIKLYPNRLDMRFGKIYVLGELKDWPRFTDEVVSTVKYSSKNKNEWTWTNNEEQPDGKNFFLSSLQDYQLTLYNTGDDALLPNMRTIAQEILKHYPNHVESLSNLSITYMLEEKYEQAIETLNKAEEMSPNDGVVISNLAYAYRLNGNKEKAIECYERMLSLEDDPKGVQFAKEQLKKLKE